MRWAYACRGNPLPVIETNGSFCFQKRWRDMRYAGYRLMAFTMIFIVIQPSVFAAEEMVLEKVMKEQAKNMQRIAGGIAREDYEQVVKASLAVIDPPHPSSTLGEKLKLMGFLGTDIGRFKELDGNTKERAATLAKAARSQNGEATIAAFQRLQMSCLACHSEFRTPFQDYFNH
jgi:cytochrome c556